MNSRVFARGHSKLVFLCFPFSLFPFFVGKRGVNDLFKTFNQRKAVFTIFQANIRQEYMLYIFTKITSSSSSPT